MDNALKRRYNDSKLIICNVFFFLFLFCLGCPENRIPLSQLLQAAQAERIAELNYQLTVIVSSFQSVIHPYIQYSCIEPKEVLKMIFCAGILYPCATVDPPLSMVTSRQHRLWCQASKVLPQASSYQLFYRGRV